MSEELDVHLILDNYGTHKTKLIRDWLAKPPRFHVHFTPTSASWLNLVERWFALLTERQLRRGVISTRFNNKQQAFFGDFVLYHYVRVDVEELDQERLTPWLRLKYHNSISDALADLGQAEEIGQVFAGFQKYQPQGLRHEERRTMNSSEQNTYPRWPDQYSSTDGQRKFRSLKYFLLFWIAFLEILIYDGPILIVV